MRLKWYGTATILLEKNGTKILFDPFLPLSDKVYQPPLGELSEVDGIFVTHGHFDHMAAIPAILDQNDGSAKVHCTAKPRVILLSKGIDEANTRLISPGDINSVGPFEVRVLRAKHIAFNMGLIIRTLFSPRIFTNWSNFANVIKAKENRERGTETVAYDIRCQTKRILLLGSLNLDPDVDYPKGADLLILPLQGRSDICSYAIPFIDRLQPKGILIDHFDDTFPPFTSSVNPEHFTSLMRKSHPDITVLCVPASDNWIEI